MPAFALPFPTFTPGTNIDATQVTANNTSIVNEFNTLIGEIPAAVPGIFVSTMSPSATAANNTTALQNDLNTFIAAGGGTYILPYGICQISGPVYVGSPINTSGTYAPIRIMGAGNNSAIQQTTNNDIFQINSTTSGGLDGPGVDIFNCRLLYTAGLTSGAAIRAVSGQCIRIDKVFFSDCPVAIAADNAAQMSIIRCLGIYSQNTSPANLAMVTIGTALAGGSFAAVEVYMAGCTWRTTAINSGGVGGFGISLFGIEHFRMQNCRVEAFQQGISVIPSTVGKQATNLHFENVSVFTDNNATGVGAAWYFKPQNTQTIQQVVMINCEAHPGLVAGTSYTGAGIVFDASSGSGAVIDQVRLHSCYSAGWNGEGLRLIGSGGILQNVLVEGGAYICNGVTQSGTSGAGIHITTGNVGSVGFYIRNAQLDNSSSVYSATQTYGVAVDGGVDAHIEVDNCPMAGLVTAPVTAASPPGHFFVRNCRGYNVLNTLVAGIGQLPLTTVQFDATTVGTTPYYGPCIVFISGGTVSAIKYSHDRSGISSTATGLTSGTFSLACGQSMEIDYSGSPTTFQVFGQ